MRTVSPPIVFATGSIRRSNSSPSWSSTTSGRVTSARPVVSLENASGFTSASSARGSVPRRTKCFASSRLALCSLDLLGDELCVVLDPSDERRASGVLPRKAEEVETRKVGHAAPVLDSPGGIDERQIDPGVVGAIPGRPDHGIDLEFAAVGKGRSTARGTGDARLERNAVAAYLARARPDERVA